MSDERGDLAPAGASKVDPESLVLRGRPARVVRFRRGVIIAIAALGSTALIGTAWMALKPPSLGQIVSGEDRAANAASAAPDVLAGAPRSYGDVPRLGPPLPGDLGRPILERQREMATETPVPGQGQAGQMDAAAQAAEAERQRRLAEARQAREAPVMMQLARAAAPDAGTGAAAIAPGPAAPAPAEADGAAGAPGQAQNLAFARGRGAEDSINPNRLQAPASRWQLSAGSVIAASLLTGLNSDLPGMVVAQVTQPVYDSASGRTLLIPQGAQADRPLQQRRRVRPEPRPSGLGAAGPAGRHLDRARQRAGDRRPRLCGARGPGRFSHLAAAARDRALDPARRRYAADFRGQRGRPGSRAARIRAGQCRPRGAANRRAQP